ncbi:hypothetical protein J132_06289, partial [Termitomyces sp. J132]
DGPIQFPWLSHTNYIKCSMHMVAVLVGQGYWYIFEKKVSLESLKGKELKAVENRMAEARALLILSVEDAQLAHMTDPNPHTIWENLGKVHCAYGFDSHLALQHAFITASMKKDQTIEVWIGEVCSLANCITAINVPTSSEDFIIVLTTGLPPSYETIIISLDAITLTELTLNLVISYLLNEVSHQNLTCPVVAPEPEEKSAGEAMVAMKEEKSGFTTICFYCGGTGHFAASGEVRMKHLKAIDQKFAGLVIFPDKDDEVNFAF